MPFDDDVRSLQKVMEGIVALVMLPAPHDDLECQLPDQELQQLVLSSVRDMSGLE